MKDKYIARKDKKLLVHAKMIFGNVVTEAYKAAQEPPSEDLVTEWLDFTVDYDKDKKLLDYSGDQIILKFSSGKFVFFTGYEWATMKSLANEDIKVYD